jgi:fatty acid amide hydrolase
LETVTRIADAVAAGRARASDVFAEHLARHREIGSALNALVQPRHAAAAREAARWDEDRPTARGDGLLAGVPVSVKECFPVRGLLTTLGIPSLRNSVDGGDAWLVERLREAGAIVVGKANVPQAMYLHETDNPVWGRTLHPGDPDRGPGGSSGGDAALVAAGVVPLAVGNDLAGSIRQPAHACGIAGIVPCSGSLGDGGAFETMPHLTPVRPRAGFLARQVADLERALVAVGAVADGPAAAGRRRPLRIGFWDDAGPLPASAAIRRGVASGVSRLREAGAQVTRLDGTLAVEAAWVHLAILSADGGADVRRLFAGTRPVPQVALLLRLAAVPQSVRPWLSAMVRLVGRRIEAEGLLATGPRDPGAFGELLRLRSGIAARVASLSADYDAVICPVSAVPALRHGTAARLVVAAAPCLLANLLDLPAGTVPVTRVRPEEEAGRPWSWDPVIRAAAETDRGSGGLPVGIQVVGLNGGTGGEATVLEVMRLIERGGIE